MDTSVLDSTAVVFAKAGSGNSLLDLAVVMLECDVNEAMATECAARGYDLCGTISVRDGKATIQSEPGDFAAAAMFYGAATHVELLAVRAANYRAREADQT